VTDRHDLASRFGLLKVLVSKLGEAKTAADAEIRDTWRVKDRAAAVLPGDYAIGSVTLAKGRATSKLTDEAAYEAWVRKTHPDEIETVTIERVNTDFTQRLMSAARQLGIAVDAATGEEVPGIEVVEGDPYPTVRLAPDAAEIVAQAWQDGTLTEVVASLLRGQIEAGGER
jgi:hypothetical protein